MGKLPRRGLWAALILVVVGAGCGDNRADLDKEKANQQFKQTLLNHIYLQLVEIVTTGEQSLNPEGPSARLHSEFDCGLGVASQLGTRYQASGRSTYSNLGHAANGFMALSTARQETISWSAPGFKLSCDDLKNLVPVIKDRQGSVVANTEVQLEKRRKLQFDDQTPTISQLRVSGQRTIRFTGVPDTEGSTGIAASAEEATAGTIRVPDKTIGTNLQPEGDWLGLDLTFETAAAKPLNFELVYSDNKLTGYRQISGELVAELEDGSSLNMELGELDLRHLDGCRPIGGKINAVFSGVLHGSYQLDFDLAVVDAALDFEGAELEPLPFLPEGCALLETN